MSCQVLEMLPGEEHVFLSVDKGIGENRTMELPAEFYNTLTPSGLPPHKLRLKEVLPCGKWNSAKERYIRDACSFSCATSMSLEVYAMEQS